MQLLRLISHMKMLDRWPNKQLTVFIQVAKNITRSALSRRPLWISIENRQTHKHSHTDMALYVLDNLSNCDRGWGLSIFYTLFGLSIL